MSRLGDRSCPPGAFFFLHLCAAWPVGVIGLALGSSLVKAGVSVQQTAAIIAASTLAFTLEFLWAPMVDSSLTRRRWFIGGAGAMCAFLAALLLAPQDPKSVPLMTVLAFAASSGAAVAAVAVKGIMAYDVPAAKLGSASGFYTGGGTFAKAVGGAGTLWLLTHSPGRIGAVSLSLTAAALAGAAILLASPGRPASVRELPQKLRFAFADLWAFMCTREGRMIAVLCVIPFGAGTEAGLIGAIAHEWAVTPDQLAGFSALGAATSIAGAIVAGWLSLRIGAWKTYVLLGWLMITVTVGFAFSPRTAAYFIGIELLYRALAAGCYAALLGIVMTAIGKGAAATKAASLWSLANFAVAYPTALEGAVHDHAGIGAMLLTDAALGVAGFGVLLVAARLLALRLSSPVMRDSSRTA
jgi:MFS transporter, PAT family, beta-lactamase induction signal transducer AmpG